MQSSLFSICSLIFWTELKDFAKFEKWDFRDSFMTEILKLLNLMWQANMTLKS